MEIEMQAAPSVYHHSCQHDGPRFLECLWYWTFHIDINVIVAMIQNFAVRILQSLGHED